MPATCMFLFFQIGDTWWFVSLKSTLKVGKHSRIPFRSLGHDVINPIEVNLKTILLKETDFEKKSEYDACWYSVWCFDVSKVVSQY